MFFSIAFYCLQVTWPLVNTICDHERPIEFVKIRNRMSKELVLGVFVFGFFPLAHFLYAVIHRNSLSDNVKRINADLR